jgi:hypothetical protein
VVSKISLFAKKILYKTYFYTKYVLLKTINCSVAVIKENLEKFSAAHRVPAPFPKLFILTQPTPKKNLDFSLDFNLLIATLTYKK